MKGKFTVTVVALMFAMAARAQLQQINTGNGVFHYMEQGSGIPIIFIHGSLADYRGFQPQLDPFSANYRAIVYSRRYNFPNENKTAVTNYSAETEADDLAAIIRALNLEPVHVVGHSFGAFTAAVFAKKYPSLARTVTLSEPPIMTWLADIPESREEYEKYINQLVRPVQIAFSLRDTASVLRHTFNYLAGEDISAKMPPDAKAAIINNLEEWRMMFSNNETMSASMLTPDDVKAFPMPVMVISGGKTHPALKAVNAELVKILPNAKHFHIPDGAHDLWAAHADAVNNAVMEFISLYK